MHRANKRNEIKMADTNGHIEKYDNQSKSNVLCRKCHPKILLFLMFKRDVVYILENSMVKSNWRAIFFKYMFFFFERKFFKKLLEHMQIFHGN